MTENPYTIIKNYFFKKADLGKTFYCYKKSFFIKSQVPVTHTCNPSYSRGRDQEDHGSKPVQANRS
jgi:hypothetical protein